MSDSQTRRQKRTDDASIRTTRSYHAVPADWHRLGRHDDVRADRARFYAEKICYEYTLARDGRAGMRERHELHVAYRNPETGEAVERTYQAAIVETDADTVCVLTSERDGDIGPDEWGAIEIAAIEPEENTAAIPKCVHRGEPKNFRASIAVHPDEPRLTGQR